MDQNIQELFNLFDSSQQKEVVTTLARHYNKKPLSIRNNWFSGYKQIPDQYHDEVLKILQNGILIKNLTPQL
jgi:hypothetical protein|tara:strand:+ start:383 stop:598 length:216 start_codon:yes stop_codon:yes gene_type:complete